jgi:DNA-binding NarL/FixJ family response regulator
MSGYRVIIVDDHPLFRDALKQTLTAALPGIAIEEAGTLDQVTAALT